MSEAESLPGPTRVLITLSGQLASYLLDRPPDVLAPDLRLRDPRQPPPTAIPSTLFSLTTRQIQNLLFFPLRSKYAR